MTAPRRVSERFVIVGDMLCEDVGYHTCGAGGEFGHEPGCGLEPLIPLDDLDAMMRAGSRFAARILSGPYSPEDRARDLVRVELWTGDRYEPRHPSARVRAPFAVVDLPREQAADLVLTLGEVPRHELPEDERGPDPWARL